MGLTFKREDNLDTLFDSFAIDPDKKEAPKKETDKEPEKEQTLQKHNEEDQA